MDIQKLFEELLNDSAKSLATHHEKIMIAVEVCDAFDVMKAHVRSLCDSAVKGNSEAIVSKMKCIVPEFKSLNSEFQILDIEVNDSDVYNN